VPRFVAEYRRLAKGGANFHGLSILQHSAEIHELITRTGSVTLLDYGAGRGDAYDDAHALHTLWGVPRPILYDPAFPEIDRMPVGKFDGVLCSDVLEHVPDEELDVFIPSLFEYADKFVWASVCCRAAKKCFPSGENMHVTIRPMSWWRRRFKHASGGRLFVLTETP
jgi:hypothetical protein